MRQCFAGLRLDVPAQYLEEGDPLPAAPAPTAPLADAGEEEDLTLPQAPALVPPTNEKHPDRRLLRFTGMNSYFVEQAAAASLAGGRAR
ncbi:hypothetical protein IMZ48_40660 [Candidatus Bathyarchaeota archaeon]|nr:hypothetical protein [Candidatus Bathyarchaeota archaeon]